MIDNETNLDSYGSAYRIIRDIELFEGRYFILSEEIFNEFSLKTKDSPEIKGNAIIAHDLDESQQTSNEVRDLSELESFHEKIKGCLRCELGGKRKKFVFGSGKENSDIMFIGEAPGEEEDRTGKPFVGAAGELLTKIIEAMHLKRDDVYICNILKCRPPNNRDPRNSEIASCEPYLVKQIELVKPKVICALGRFAAQTLLGSNESMGRLRLNSHSFQGIPVVATYHPAALLRNPQWKRPTWEDMKKVRRLCDGVEL